MHRCTRTLYTPGGTADGLSSGELIDNPKRTRIHNEAMPLESMRTASKTHSGKCHKLLCGFGGSLDNRLPDEIGSGIPCGVLGKDRNDIPEDSLMPAAIHLQSSQMCAELCSNQMVLIPELHDSRVCNSLLHKTAGAKPVGG